MLQRLRQYWCWSLPMFLKMVCFVAVLVVPLFLWVQLFWIPCLLCYQPRAFLHLVKHATERERDRVINSES